MAKANGWGGSHVGRRRRYLQSCAGEHCRVNVRTVSGRVKYFAVCAVCSQAGTFDLGRDLFDWWQSHAWDEHALDIPDQPDTRRAP